MGLYFWGPIGAYRSWTSFLDTWHHGFYQIPTHKKINKSHVWIFQLHNNPNTNLKNNTQMGHWAQNQASALVIPVLWPEPVENEWTEEKKHHHGDVNLKDLERFWMKEWSLISCQVFSNLIRYYRRTFRAVKLANGGFKQYWIKGCR